MKTNKCIHNKYYGLCNDCSPPNPNKSVLKPTPQDNYWEEIIPNLGQDPNII